MTTFSPSITLDAEHLDALTALVTAHNEQAGTTLSAEQYLEAVLSGIIADKVRQRFAASVERIGAAAASLPYEARLGLIAQVEAALAPS